MIRLQLTTEEGLEPGPYSATVSAAGGAMVFSASHLAPRTEAGRRYIDLRLNAASLADGDYTIDLSAESASQNQPALRYNFALLAAPTAAAK
jgi:hypothetical protein